MTINLWYHFAYHQLITDLPLTLRNNVSVCTSQRYSQSFLRRSATTDIHPRQLTSTS